MCEGEPNWEAIALRATAKVDRLREGMAYIAGVAGDRSQTRFGFECAKRLVKIESVAKSALEASGGEGTTTEGTD